MLLQIQKCNVEEKKQLQKIWDTDYQTIVSGKDNGVPFLKYVFQLHFKLFGETCSTCPNKIPGYIKKIKSLNPQNSKIMTQENKTTLFRLQERVTIPVAGTSTVYSQHNLTDEIAVELIAKNPNRKALFAKLPENLDELIEKFNSKTEDTGSEELVTVGDVQITVEQALDILEKNNLKTRATTAQGLEKFINGLKDDAKSEILILAQDIKGTQGAATLEVVERTKEDVVFDLEKAEQDLEDLLDVFPDGNEESSALEEKIEELKKELETYN
jgi:hypothetical protein